MATKTPCHIDSLPNEILSAIFSSFQTPPLLHLALVSRHFHSAVHSQLRLRLLRIAALSNRGVILECYHPTTKLSTPYLTCQATTNAQENLAELDDDINALSTHYSRFRPTLHDGGIWTGKRRRHPPHASQVDAVVFPSPVLEQQDAEADKQATIDVTLDSCELFAELCVVTNVVTLGPRRGLFTGHVNVSDGAVRVWRDWLAERVGQQSNMGEGDILWADRHKDVGVRFRVAMEYESAMQQPLLLGPDDDPVISYKLVYEELLVRTTRILLSNEKAEDDIQHSGKAIVIAS